jgi:hypothetical protein
MFVVREEIERRCIRRHCFWFLFSNVDGGEESRMSRWGGGE